MTNTFRFLFVVFSIFTTVNPLYAQWIQTNGPYGGEVYSFAVSGTNLFAGTYNSGVFLSTNNGTNWSAVNTGLTNTDVNALAVSGTNLFAGTSGGVFLSTDNGSSWTGASTGLTNTTVHALAVVGTNLFAGTLSGVWRRPLSEVMTSVEKLSTDLPTHLSLDQNYPNPFNPSTTIRYELAKRAIISLRIFNMLGQEIALLVDEQKEAGSYQVQWNANVPSGIYFYRLQAAEFVETKKAILLK